MSTVLTTRKDQWEVSLLVDGVGMGVFDVKTGGETDTTELTYMPGGMAPQVSLGGMVAVAAIVISRLYRRDRDHLNIHWLLGRVGKGKCVVRQQVLDINGAAWGTNLVARGTLKRVTLPEVDSNSTDAAIIEIEITPEGAIT